MKEITLIVNKINVYDEVAKTTSYAGSKMVGDDTAYSRIFTTDDDRMMLERFWVEACSAATEVFKSYLLTATEQPESHGVELERNYVVTLGLPSSFDEILKDSMNTSLYSFFVSAIVGKWYKFTNKGEQESYISEAVSMLGSVERQMYYRKKPKRTIPV